MKIQDASVLMTSTKTFQTQYEEKEHLRVWIDPQDPWLSEDRITLSRQARSCSAEAASHGDGPLTDDYACLKVTLEVLLAEVLTGRKCEILDMARFEKGRIPPEDTLSNQGMGSDTLRDPSSDRVGWAVDYSHQACSYEKEAVTFFAVGIIRTADGKDVDFALRVDMHREYVTHHSLSLRAGDAALMDPLVVNFNGNTAQLGNTTFAFDLDVDGDEELLPTLQPGSGFLAIDFNHDGMIANGGELFGPQTGQGFAELSAYDADGNHWIDEADPAFDQLSVWTMDDQGNHALSPLRDRGIGAIYLKNLASEFDLKGTDNALKGRISNTGVFLNEEGGAGTIQQLDLAV